MVAQMLSSSEILKEAGGPPQKGFCWRARLAALLCLLACTCAHANERKQPRQSPNALNVLLNASLADVVKAVEAVAGDQIIHGSQTYQREKNLTGAQRAQNSQAFGDFNSPGTVLYKVMESALSPTNFKNSADMGTITVRYVVTAFDEKNTNLRIDAIFVENATRRAHESDGSVEAAEFGEIRQHVEQLQAQHEVEKQEEARVAHEREERQKELDFSAHQDAKRAAADTASLDLELRVLELRKKTEMRISASGTQLKSAPYKAAANIQNLAPYTQVVVLIITPYWYGVQTEDGHRGWIYHREIEALQ